jgi:para-aminobenzoate synthetase
MPLEVVKHGQVSILQHTGTDLFEGVNEIRAVRYHSLHVRPPSTSDVIVPLAWADDGSENGGLVLMAAKHKEKPFWGVQYHPESICSSSDAGIQVVRNFWKMAQEWNERSRSRLDLLSEYLGPSVPSFVTPLVPTPSPAPKYSVNTVTISSMSTALTITRICELLGFQSPSSEHLLLDSASAPAMGRFSVIGVVDETTPRITYSVGHTSVAIGDGQFQLDGKSIWKWLAEYMSQNQAVGGAEDSPFWGGLVGYFTYEVGVASLDIPIPRERGTKPDVALAFIHRSLVIDHVQHTIYLQSLLPDDESWLQNTSRLLTLAGDPAFTPSPSPPPSTDDALPQSTYPSPKITMPNKDGYIAAIKRAQSYLAQGESYELCLTALTKITFDTSSQLKSDWQLFKTLRQRNPAPFSAFLRLGGNTLIGSSPERFLSWTRSGHCQLRPIKGTVKKSPDMTFERAKELLYVPKEIAENLMIVDLIRHDLHQVAGDSVKVSKLFEVEEYETVFQLVSVIEGQVDQEKGFTGFDVLSRSLPPG